MKTFILVLLVITNYTLFSQNISDTTKIINGTIISKNKDIIEIKTTSTYKVQIHSKGIMSKYFEEKILGVNTTGWLDIGLVEIVNNKTNSIKLKLIEEHSVITKNGGKVNNFKTGNKVKIELK